MSLLTIERIKELEQVMIVVEGWHNHQLGIAVEPEWFVSPTGDDIDALTFAELKEFICEWKAKQK